MYNLQKHKQTDEEAYQELKRAYRIDSDKTLMDPEKWKARRLKQLKKDGKVWSR